MTNRADIRRRIEALIGRMTPPRELQLQDAIARLSDEQRCEYQRHQAALEQFHAMSRAAGHTGGDLYEQMLDDQSMWAQIYPTLRRDVADVLYGTSASILETDSEEQAARKNRAQHPPRHRRRPR